MSESDYTKLFQLVKSGHYYDLDEFLSRDHPIDLNRVNPTTHLTPLMVACKSNIKLLIEKGAEVDYQYNHQGCALMRAVEKGNVGAVQTLISCGAQVDLKDSEGKSALGIACERGDVDIIDAFLEAEGIRGSLIKGKEVDYKDGYSVSYSPFNIAVKYDHIKSVRRLLKRSVKVIPVDALFIAIYNNSSEMVQLFLDHVTNYYGNSDLIKMLDDFRRKHKVSALILAASKGNVGIVKELLEIDADVNLKGKGGSTALLSVLSAEDYIVRQQSKVDIVKLLLSRGAHVDQQDILGPLLKAIEEGNYKLAELLLENGAALVMGEESALRSLQRTPRQILDSISQQQPDVQQFPKLRSLLEQLMGEQESSATPNPGYPQDNVPGSTDSRGTLPQRSDNANNTNGEHLTRENCHTEEPHDGADNTIEFIALKSSMRSLRATLASLQNNERKFSIIAYGVSECPEGTSKPDQSSHDFGEVASFLLKVDSSIQPQSIKDMHRLGKYHHERPRPRPILVKFIRSADVSKVLAKRSLIQPPYSVKPYLSKEEQRCESALLKERWSLIQSGTSRESIKIRLKDGWIMVDSKLYGKWDSTTNTLIKQ